MILGVMVMIALIIIMSIVSQRRFEKSKDKPVKGDELPIWPFEPMPIMTDTEVLFFAKLQQAVPEYHIFGQVQLSRIIQPSDAAEGDRSFWLNRICRQSVDYVLVARDAQTTLLAIELDDWTHDSASRSKADEKKDKALASAGIPILRFHAERMPSADIIRHDIKAVLRKYGSG
ncbi:DUF2726 domain-containing protein [Psychrobacter sp. FDAARGOS_221]|uniref:DUF2726 domain-containing protein n=1 Tax=Psychrobacter sp. FDAARGOS_221 TaxID=1975705 RepID=UPI000BB599F5|nr:DUF2726 domain-containing protein [Psychrobacter sp. FDAARGOS_221]PNK61323.1 DUF2726 domain-containing protein [Psychrobacter sp. FDAARGOS_221]